MALNLVPQANQSLGQTQNPILTNFTVIDTTYSTDHVTFNALSNQGLHNKVTFVQQAGTIPAADIGTDNILMYGLISGDTSRTELFLKRFTDGNINLGIPFTVYKNPSAALNYTYLPSGVLVQWGVVSVGPAGTSPTVAQVDIDLVALGGKSYSNFSYNVFVSTQISASALYIVSATPNTANNFSFKINAYTIAGATGNSALVNWMTIGI
jgi:hypothetical protein